jgi:hypothetical protein
MQLKKYFKSIALLTLIAFLPFQLGHADSGLLIGSGGGGGGGASTYTNATPVPVTIGGITAGTTFTAQTMQQMFDALLYPYIAPTISLNSSPGSGVYEFGDPQAPITLNATTVANTNPISSVIFQRSNNGGAYSTIETVGVPNPAGGAENYIDVTGVGGFASTSYRATVGDGTATSNSSVRTYTYVYPFYYGVGAPGLSDAAIGGLTKIIETVGDKTRPFSPSTQVFYFAYPSAYPTLTRVLDPSSFDITADFTIRTVTITGLDGTPQSYRVYEYNNLTTQTAFNLTFDF